MALAEMKCTPCRGGVEPLRGEKLRQYRDQLPTWELVGEHHITRTFKFKNFAQALELVNRIGTLAEEEGHHPWIAFAWGFVRVELWTHKIDGLHESDFVLAAKIERLWEGR
jgi:4a-hydroxytetrahydrobiopterin dehydratase